MTASRVNGHRKYRGVPKTLAAQYARDLYLENLETDASELYDMATSLRAEPMTGEKVQQMLRLTCSLMCRVTAVALLHQIPPDMIHPAASAGDEGGPGDGESPDGGNPSETTKDTP